jgi:hypothetical protein
MNEAFVKGFVVLNDHKMCPMALCARHLKGTFARCNHRGTVKVLYA